MNDPETIIGMTGFYIHIPFCAQKCFYCDFVITLQQSTAARERFFAALEREIDRAFQVHGKIIFDTFYIGGGTPSLLTPEEMARLVEKIKNRYELKPGFEFTCEFNPGDLDSGKIKSFQCLGINRISLGAQAFQDRLLQEMGRQHTVRDIHATVQMIRDAGIHNISFDLIGGLPNQTLEDFIHSLKQTIALNPSQISLYDLEIHDKTPWGMARQKGQFVLPAEELRAEMFQAAIDHLTGAGYQQYEISTFAKPGFESRHNLIYWNNQEYLGLGPGAFSYINGTRSQFSRGVPEYHRKCEAGDWEPAVKDVLTEAEKEMETLVTGLRLKQGIDLGYFKRIRPQIEERVRDLENDHLLDRSGDRIALTPRGRFLAEQVFGTLCSSENDKDQKGSDPKRAFRV